MKTIRSSFVLKLAAPPISLTAVALLLSGGFGAGSRADANPGQFSLSIDAVPGGTPCSTIDAARNVKPNATFDVDICLTNSAATNTLGSFSFEVNYATTVITAPEVADVAPALDDNPDFDQASVTGTWTCYFPPPKGDDGTKGAGFGAASLSCFGISGWPAIVNGGTLRLATIHLVAGPTKGSNTALTLKGVAVRAYIGLELMSCNPVITYAGKCINATINVQNNPTATAVLPTATAVPPTATAIPPTATAVPPTATAVPPTATAGPPPLGGVAGYPDLGGGSNAGFVLGGSALAALLFGLAAWRMRRVVRVS